MSLLYWKENQMNWRPEMIWVLTCTNTHTAHVFRVLIRDPDGEAASLLDLMMAISRLQVDVGTVHAADTRDRVLFVFNQDF